MSSTQDDSLTALRDTLSPPPPLPAEYANGRGSDDYSKYPDMAADAKPAAGKKKTSPPANNDIITEDLAALEFACRYEGELLHDHDAGSWYVWTGARWERNGTDLAFHWAREMARELARNEDPKARYILSKAGFAGAVEKLAKADPTFAVRSDTWDRDPLLLGTPAGTVDLRTGELRPASPDDRITKLTSVGPAESTAECPRWLQFLDEATGKDDELIRFLQQWAGYCLTGLVSEHALVFIHGGGGEGKTTFVNGVSRPMGDYATVAPMDTFVSSLGDRHPTELADLRGARLVSASETEENRTWAEARIKLLTGGDPIKARFMRQDFFRYLPQFKLTFLGNHYPLIRSVDDAVRRRFNIVPFTCKPPVPDHQLEQKLVAEAPGILRWAIDGCLDWQQNGLVRPPIVAETTESYFADQDVFGQWLEDECDVKRGNEHVTELVADLFESWTKYAIAAGEKPGSMTSFSGAMKKRRFPKYRVGKIGARGFRFLRLRRPVIQQHYDD
jgi:putative DNA primase/helicase